MKNKTKLNKHFTLFGWVKDNKWNPLKIDMVLLQKQKEWLYKRRILSFQRPAQKTNDYDAEILDGIIEMFESIQDLWSLQKEKE